MADNFIEIIKEIRGSTLDPATDVTCIYGDIKQMHLEYVVFGQITPEERAKLELIEPEATKNQSDAYLLNRTNHTGTQSADSITDGVSKVAMTFAERTKLNEISDGATANATDADLRNRATHTGIQSIDTIVNSATNVKMTVEERARLFAIEDEATKNDTNSQLRDRSTHTGTQSADTITPGSTNGVFTLVEKDKLATLNSTIDDAHITDVNWNKLTSVPLTFSPSAHAHSMSEITSGNLSATRISETLDLQFVDNAEKSRIADSEVLSNKGVPYGYAPLDGNGKINASYLSDLNLLEVFTPVNLTAMLLITSAQPGDIAYVQDTEDSYMLIALPSNVLDNWKKLNTISTVISVNGQTGLVSLGSDDITEGMTNKYYTDERVDNRVNGLLKAGTNINLVYNDSLNELTINANDTSIEWSEVQNKPDPTISVNISGDITGSGSVTLTDLNNGTLNITNMTLESAGTAGTYRSVTTDSNGRVVSGTNPTTIAGYSISDAYTKTEVQETLPSIGLDTTNAVAPTRAGQFKWNQEEGTADLRLQNGVTLQLGQENNRLVRNNTGATISNGTVLIATGSLGASGRITVGPATGLFDGAKNIYGIATQDILNGADGYCTIEGKVRGINTSGSTVGETWTDGQILYVKPNDNGRLTNVEPAYGELKVSIAKVIHAHATNGLLEVRTTSVLNENAYEPRNTNIQTHIARTDNPHGVTKSQLGLGNVTNFDTTNATNITSGTLSSSRFPLTGVAAGTYKSVTVDTTGRITAGTNPTTIAGFGITDAYTKSQMDTSLALKVDDTEIASVNLLRADKYLSAQNIANMIYTDGNLTKIQYNNATNVDYEILNYTTGNLTSINHYVGSVLKGTTTLSYTSGNLVSAIFVGV